VPQAAFRFYAELNDFLPPARRFIEFTHPFLDTATVKDFIESFGIPHTEVDLILVNGNPVDFAHHVRDGDRVSVYPVFEAFDIAGVSRVRPEPLREPRFILNTHLGRLAAFLRMLGFDCLYRTCYADEQLAAISRDERRILLTRDIGLLKRGAVTHGYFVRETDPQKHLPEIVSRFDLARLTRPFSRCMRCNTPLVEVAKSEVLAELPPRTAAAHDDFRRCPTCRRIYWKGAHYRRMLALIP
jgi:uncharacterized protein with PIN domain/sulfur carrier protein ThiS